MEMKVKSTPKISVIVAIYNVEQYIEKCAISLFNQTLEDIEYIFVDDCSTDNSINVLKSIINKYPHRAESIKIIKNLKNSKVAYSRTIGMKKATGTYVIHCDSDDFIELDFYETVYNAAINTGADIVATNHYRETKNSVIEVKGNYYSTKPKECIKNLYRNNFPLFLWSHLVKRSLYIDNNIYPYEGINTGEDLNVLLRIFHFAKKITYIDKAYYHYVMRESSLSQNKDVMSLWNNNISNNLKHLIKFFESKDDGEYSTMLNYLKFSKKQILLSAKPPQTKIWYDIYSECRRDILKFSHLPITRRLLYLLFSYSYPLLNLYFKLKYR